MVGHLCSSESFYDSGFGHHRPREEGAAGGLQVGLLLGCRGRTSVRLVFLPRRAASSKREVSCEHCLWKTSSFHGELEQNWFKV